MDLIKLKSFCTAKETISSVQLLSHVWLSATQWTAARQASLSVTNPWSLLNLMSVESVMPSNHLILCRPLLLLPSIFPSIRVFSNESALCIRWPKYWSFSISPSQEDSEWISFRTDYIFWPISSFIRWKLHISIPSEFVSPNYASVKRRSQKKRKDLLWLNKFGKCCIIYSSLWRLTVY